MGSGSRLLRLLFLLLCTLSIPSAAEEAPHCSGLDNGQVSDNPVYREPSCSSRCDVCSACIDPSPSPSERCPSSACSSATADGETGLCPVDGYVGSHVILEDELQRVWNFTLLPGQMTSMHRHDFDYSFVAVTPSRLEVFGEDGERLFDFWATGAAFRVVGDFLEPTGGATLPWKVPRVHAARNIGTNIYHEILFENKHSTNVSSSGGREEL